MFFFLSEKLKIEFRSRSSVQAAFSGLAGREKLFTDSVLEYLFKFSLNAVKLEKFMWIALKLHLLTLIKLVINLQQSFPCVFLGILKNSCVHYRFHTLANLSFFNYSLTLWEISSFTLLLRVR